MSLNKLLILLIVVLFLFQPVFASDYYFDSSIDVDGNGTVENPYREFSNDKITNNSAIHLAGGNYSLRNSCSLSNISFHGKTPHETILNGNGFEIKCIDVLNFKNITLTNFKLNNAGNLTAKNTVFSNLISTTVKYDSYGGAIYAPSNKNIYIDNCTFLNNTAGHGGAIYAEGGNLFILNSVFMYNTAENFGGSIASRNTRLIINNTLFKHSKSKNDAGGTLYILSCQLNASNISVLNSTANFGGAITLLLSDTNIVNSTFKNNRAKYNAGAIYTLYGSLNLTSSKFINNTADNGGALYINEVSSNISSNEFINNTAFNTAGAIYSLLSNNTSNNTFINNDVYNTTKINIVIGNGNYTLYINNQTYNTTLPDYYNLNDYGYVTIPKNQQDGGNCWAFAAMSALESCILKASGDVLDLSENNMKNLLARFSDYGINYRFPNSGGDNNMPIGYLISWLGAVLESEDEYRDKNHISPVLDSVVHVQNVVFLKRSNYTDNDDIKLAIINYGAVATTMYYDVAKWVGNKVCHYYSGNSTTNHAVAIVGWDDNLSIPDAPGKGAWIVKNSWGPDWANNGYFYVSYYDTAFARPNSTASYTFIFNDALHYDKNYQYDFSGTTDYFYLPNNTVWYQNRYVASDNEFLASVSTYFLKNTTYEIEISVNDKLQLTQSGSSKAGYYTINLKQPIPLVKGDVFKVTFKITVGGDVAFPISEYMSLNKYAYDVNCSFISLDGVNFSDLYNYTWNDYPGHYYNSQVACIKAFTQLITLNSTIKSINITYDSFNLFNITVSLLDENRNTVGNGEVIINVNNVNYTVSVYNGIAFLKTPLIVGKNNISAIFKSPNYYSSHDNTSFDVAPLSLDLNITVKQILNNASVMFNLSQKVNESIIINNMTFKTVNGVYILNLTDLDYGNYTVEACLNSSFYRAFKSSKFFVNVKKTHIEVNNLTTVYNSGEFLKITLKDEFNQPVVGRSVVLKINDEIYANITDSNGEAFISINLPDSTYSAVVTFSSDDLYLKSQNHSTIRVISSVILPEIKTYTYNSNYEVYLIDKQGDPLNNSEITFKVNNLVYYAFSDNDGKVFISIPLKSGDGEIKVVNPDTLEESLDKITILNRISENKDINIYYGAGTQYVVRVLGDFGNFTPNIAVTFTLNGVKYVRFTDSNGYVNLDIKNLKSGKYTIIAECRGFRVFNSIVVKSTLITKNIKVKKGKTIKFTAKLLNSNGKVLKAKKITFKFKGKTYKAKTNKKGIATLKIKNKYKSRKYSIITSYNKIKVKNTIQLKNN